MAALAVSLGDPAGIGPELLCEAWARRHEARLPAVLRGGRRAACSQRRPVRAGSNCTPESIADQAEAEAAFATHLPVLALDASELDDCAYAPGQPQRSGAEFALASLRRAAALAVAGEAAGIVTGPVAKALLAEVGFAFPGQTEFVARQACGCGTGCGDDACRPAPADGAAHRSLRFGRGAGPALDRADRGARPDRRRGA